MHATAEPYEEGGSTDPRSETHWRVGYRTGDHMGTPTSGRRAAVAGDVT
ncbi:hypothetical protein [Streptomyces sp. NEAU-NA10]